MLLKHDVHGVVNLDDVYVIKKSSGSIKFYMDKEYFCYWLGNDGDIDIKDIGITWDNIVKTISSSNNMSNGIFNKPVSFIYSDCLLLNLYYITSASMSYRNRNRRYYISYSMGGRFSSSFACDTEQQAQSIYDIIIEYMMGGESEESILIKV